jgi:hypothetical protein
LIANRNARSFTVAGLGDRIGTASSGPAAHDRHNTPVDLDGLLDFVRPGPHRHLVVPEAGEVAQRAARPTVQRAGVVSGEHPDRDDHCEAMTRQGKVLLRITPTRWGPLATGGFPARLAD